MRDLLAIISQSFSKIFWILAILTSWIVAIVMISKVRNLIEKMAKYEPKIYEA
jgi:hypothetical protein